MFKLRLIAFFVSLIAFVSAQQDPSPQAVIQTELLKCPMYSKHCFLNVLLASSVNSSDLQTTTSGSDRIFKYLGIGLCKDTEKYRCPNQQSFEKALDNRTLDGDYQVYSVHLYPGLFGQANLTLVWRNQEHNVSLSAIILVTQPRRWIDHLFDISVYVFQTIISMIMGILIDVETLLKIKTLYKPVSLGKMLGENLQIILCVKREQLFFNTKVLAHNTS